MKENIELKNSETFSLEVRKNGESVERLKNSNKLTIKNDFSREIEYSYALHQEN